MSQPGPERSRNSGDSSGPRDHSPALQTEVGEYGGKLVISQRSEPKTLNPLAALDSASKEIIGLTMADLIHINRYDQQTEPALAASWTASSDRKRWTLHLRRGLRFSDGVPFDADDVVFTFRCYLDENVHSPQRDLLLISGHPIEVIKTDQHTVTFTLAAPYAAAERLFDSISILPRHLLQRYDHTKLADAWRLPMSPQTIAGLGPFRFKQYTPGERLILERNPYYWKKNSRGRDLPYLTEIISLFVPSADAETLRFEAGETDVINRLNATNFSVLKDGEKRRHFHVTDLGPGLEFDFLFFNQNQLPPGDSALQKKQSWFRLVAFRQAISSAIDREGLVRLPYRGRAFPLSVPVTPGNRMWVNHTIPPPSQSFELARKLLRTGGFTWAGDGSLHDKRGIPVAFSIAVNAGKPEQVQMCTMIQQDLKELGIDVTVAALEFHSFLDRIFKTYRYEAALLALADGDADPNSELSVLSSNGGAHVWSLKPDSEVPTWQREIDRLMQEQLVAPSYAQRKSLYDRVQLLVRENEPIICLLSPSILVGAKDQVGNFQPAILSSSTLWNAEQLFTRRQQRVAGHP